MDSAQNTQLWLVRRFLKENDIDTHLAWRVVRYIEHALEVQNKTVSMANLPALSLLSRPLQLELKYTIEFHCLSYHPFFARTEEMHHETMVHMMESALEDQSL